MSRRLIRLWRKLATERGTEVPFVYVLWSDKLQKRYVGVSDDVSNRMKQHNSGSARFTSAGIPWVLKHQEYYGTRKDALKRERFLKSGVGRSWLDENLK